MPDEKWGERPKAFVELAVGEHASEAEIIAFARERLPGYMRPDAVEFTELARTSTGKVLKQPLRDREWQGYERKVG
jgi:fatty-acyl-CoA synthase